MTQNTGKLAGLTVFITGASRGIGKAIALKCASDGANVVIAAKTADPHPKLPGTIYSAAKEVEAAGGKCLPCTMDVRNEEEVRKAVDAAVKTFGGIDILINNASAIHLTGTVDTSMKKYDLITGVNVRGTFLCSKYCIPFLKKARNPQILNISPPLNMNPIWFKDHTAYTMSKYGMSMCVLGMAEELKEDGIAVNALWPKTIVYTAAVEMLGGGGDTLRPRSRKPEIMADAAYVILTKNSRQNTGNFHVDEDVLRQAGIKDFMHYSCVPGEQLSPDFFLDVNDVNKLKTEVASALSGAAFVAEASNDTKQKKISTDNANQAIDQTFHNINAILNEEVVKAIGGVFAFDLKDGGQWYLDLKHGKGEAGKGSAPVTANCTMTLSSDDFVKMFAGKLNPTSAFMSGKLKIKGELPLAMKLEKLMKQMQKSKL